MSIFIKEFEEMNDERRQIRLTSMIEKHIQGIKDKKTKPTTKGTYKYCYLFGTIAILKNRDKYDENAPILVEPDKVFLERLKVIKYLKEVLKVNTPSLIGKYTTKHHYYEVQDRAQGNILSVNYVSTAKAIARNDNRVLDHNSSADDREKEEIIYPFEAEKIGHAMFLYNNGILKQLKSCDKQLIDKFVMDYKAITKFGIEIDSTRSENFLFDKDSGFSFIDLDTNINNACKLKSDYEIAKDMFNAFADFTKFVSYMKPEELKSVCRNSDLVKDRLLNSIVSCNFKLTPGEMQALQSRTMVGEKLYSNMKR